MKNKYLILILVFFALVLFACKTKKKEIPSDVYYTCSMDPQVMESKPGNCPICKMPLTETKKASLGKNDELHLSDQQIHLGNITVDSIRQHPMDDAFILTGILTENQDNNVVISSRVSGRIEKLFHKTTGEKIGKGQPLYEIYSEELNLAIRELKLAVEKKKIQTGSTEDLDRIISGTKNKLLLYGLIENQIAALLEKQILPENVTILSRESGIISSIDALEGSYVSEGETILHLSDYSSLWAEAEIYAEDLGKINLRKNALVYLPEFGDEKIEGNISLINPELSPSSKINRLRIEIKNENNKLKPGMQANFSIPISSMNEEKTFSLALPTDAIILDENGATVWIKTGHNRFKSVMVETGIEVGGFTEIKSGLSKNDLVVISGAYLLNSEFFFKRGSNPMAGHDMSDM